MSRPQVLRCRAAIGGRVVVVVLLGWLAVMVPVFVTSNGDYLDDYGTVETIAGGLMYAMLLFAAGYFVMGLRTRVELFGEGVVLVNVFGRSFVPWRDITGMNVDRARRSWTVTINTPYRRFDVDAFECFFNLSGRSGPPSLRRAADALYREWLARR